MSQEASTPVDRYLVVDADDTVLLLSEAAQHPGAGRPGMPLARWMDAAGVEEPDVYRIPLGDSGRTLVKIPGDSDSIHPKFHVLKQVWEVVTDLDPGRMMNALVEVMARDAVRRCAVVFCEPKVMLAAVNGQREQMPVQSGLSPFDLDIASRDIVERALAGGIDEIRTLRELDEGTPPARTPSGQTMVQWVTDRLGIQDGEEWYVAALPGHRRVLGAMLVQPAGPVRRGEDELLTELAGRIGLSLDNARLFSREHKMAQTLQNSMLPQAVPLPGLDLWSHYLPNVDSAQVGGDWYDVFHPPSGIGLVIGDVVGHDIEAAAAMGQLRSVMRACAFDNPDPADALTRVDHLVHGMRIHRSASLIYATLSAEQDGRWLLSWSRAGHLPPIVIREDGTVETLMDGGGTLIGLGDRPRKTMTTRLERGDVLLLYTDGLIERRSRQLIDGLAQLQYVCERLERMDAAGIGEYLLEELAEEPEDDLAMVVLRVPTGRPDHPGPRRRRWQLVVESGSIARARRLVAETCLLWGLDVGAEAELVVSELVANALLHGWGPIGLRLEQGDSGLLIDVQDGNPRPPKIAANHDGPGGYGLRIISRLATWGYRPVETGKVVWALVSGPSDWEHHGE